LAWAPNLGPCAGEIRNLQLLHHYTADTVECFVDSLSLGDRALNILRKDFPRLAFQQHFLMDTILAVASIHISGTEQESTTLPVARYKDQAFRTLRHAVANLSNDNKQAVMAASMLLSATSFAADRVTEHTGLWTPNWLALAMGPKIFAKRSNVSNEPTRANSTPPTLYTAGEFVDYPAPAAIPTGLKAMLHMEDDDEDLPLKPVLWHVAKSIGKLIGSLVLPGHEFWIQLKIKAWPSMIPTREFIDLVQLERPRALILLGYILVFLAYLPDVWLYKETADRDMEKLKMMLDEPWRSHLRIPMAALQIQDKTLFRAFLLSQLPPDAVSDESKYETFF
jgi:hypothetical protein